MSNVIATALALSATACSLATSPPASVEEKVMPQIVVPSGTSRPDRVCEPLGSVPSPNGRWIAFLRRAEWDRPGFRIPYLLTELWTLEQATRATHRLLDFTQIGPDWSSRSPPSATTAERAGGFTFRELSWSPNSKAIALEEAGDEWQFRGTILINVRDSRILELKGGGLVWSPDGSKAVVCNGLGLDCPDGLLVADLAHNEVRHVLAGTDVIEYGWQGTDLLAVLAYVRTKDRYGWWVYETNRHNAALQPIELPQVVPQAPATTTWWAADATGRLPCRRAAEPSPPDLGP